MSLVLGCVAKEEVKVVVKFPYSCSQYATRPWFLYACPNESTPVCCMERYLPPPISPLNRMIKTSLHCNMHSLQDLSPDFFLTQLVPIM